MKKTAFFLVILTAAIGLAACNQQKEEVKEKTKVTDTKDVHGTNKDVVKEKNTQAPKDENTTNQNKPNSNVPKDKIYQNKVFKDVVVAELGDKIIVTGKAQVFEGVFQYALYAGEKVLIENNYQTEGAPAWGEFKITLKKELITTNDFKIVLFVYSAKDGSKVNTLEIPIPKP